MGGCHLLNFQFNKNKKTGIRVQGAGVDGECAIICTGAVFEKNEFSYRLTLTGA